MAVSTSGREPSALESEANKFRSATAALGWDLLGHPPPSAIAERIASALTRYCDELRSLTFQSGTFMVLARWAFGGPGDAESESYARMATLRDHETHDQAWERLAVGLETFDAVEAQKMVTQPAIDHVFAYHPPKPDQIARFTALRGAAKTFAEEIARCCPDVHERERAIDEVRSAVMWANAAIACGEK